jgi:hypothetical protein
VRLHETKHEESAHGEGHEESSHGEGHGDAHGEEHVYKKEKFGRAEMSSTIGFMLIGNVAFQMSLFYLVNHEDPDMQRYTWTVIGTTISIFSAVLLYGSVEGILHHYILEELEKINELLPSCVNFGMMLLWFVLTQVVVMRIATTERSRPAYEQLTESQADGSSPAKGNVATPGRDKRRSLQASIQQLPQEYVHRNQSAERAKSIGGLFAHITAFAGISTFTPVQDMLAEYGLGILMCAVAPLVFLGCFRIAWGIRKSIMLSDGEVSPAEVQWEHHVCEIEDDIIGLCTSYLVMKSVARVIEGGPAGHFHDMWQVAMMFVAANVFLVGLVATVYFAEKKSHDDDSSRGHGHGNASALPLHRLLDMSKFLCSFSFAWCMLKFCTWCIMFLQNDYGWTHIWMEVMEALVVSFVSIFIIWLLDKVADLDATGPEVDECIRDSVLSFGVLIGFCWEHAFDVGVISIAERIDHFREIAQFFMCLFIALIVLPAYVMYIVPIQFRMTEQKHATPQISPRTSTDATAPQA